MSDKDERLSEQASEAVERAEEAAASAQDAAQKAYEAAELVKGISESRGQDPEGTDSTEASNDLPGDRNTPQSL